MTVFRNAQAPALALVLAATTIVEPLTAEEGEPVFVDRAAQLGVDFVHDNGMTGALYFAENMGGGAALFDADGDGDLDLYLGQGHRLAPAGDTSAPGAPEFRDRLYRNDLEAGELRFTDITAGSNTAYRRPSLEVLPRKKKVRAVKLRHPTVRLTLTAGPRLS